MKNIICIIAAIVFCSACNHNNREKEEENNPYFGKYKEYRVDAFNDNFYAHVVEIDGEKFFVIQGNGLAMIKMKENNEER